MSSRRVLVAGLVDSSARPNELFLWHFSWVSSSWLLLSGRDRELFTLHSAVASEFAWCKPLIPFLAAGYSSALTIRKVEPPSDLSRKNTSRQVMLIITYNFHRIMFFCHPGAKSTVNGGSCLQSSERKKSYNPTDFRPRCLDHCTAEWFDSLRFL